MVRRGATDRGERGGGNAAWLPPGPAGRMPHSGPGSGPGPAARRWGGAACGRGALWGGCAHPAPSGPRAAGGELGLCACPSSGFLREECGQLIGHVLAGRPEKRRASNVSFLNASLLCIFPFFCRFGLSALVQLFANV